MSEQTGDRILDNVRTIKKMAAGAFFDEEDRAYLWKLADVIEEERVFQLEEVSRPLLSVDSARRCEQVGRTLPDTSLIDAIEDEIDAEAFRKSDLIDERKQDDYDDAEGNVLWEGLK